jgi:hypothetical protein
MAVEITTNLSPALSTFGNNPQLAVDLDDVRGRVRHDEMAESVPEPPDNPISPCPRGETALSQPLSRV